MDRLISFLLDEDGQSMVEYGLIIALIALAAIVALKVFGGLVREKLYEKAINEIDNA